MSPSKAAPVPCTLGEVVTLGDRLPLASNRFDVELVGPALHSFLACDLDNASDNASENDRRKCAARLLRGYQIDSALAADNLVEAGNRLWTWLRKRHSAFRVRRELPVAQRLPSGTLLSGTADLVLTSNDSFILIDHKTFPGSLEIARERILRYSGQLHAYATAIQAGTGLRPISTWIHVPILGVACELQINGLAS